MSGKDSGDKSKKSKKKLIIILVALVVAVAGGAAGGYFMFAPHSTAEQAPTPGIVIPLDSITINLADGHFLKLKIALQATSEVTETLDGSKALDLAIDLFSNRSIAELSSNEERNRLKEELAKKIEKAYDGEVMGIYLTEFVMQ